MLAFLKNLCFKFKMWWYSRGIPTADVSGEDQDVQDFLNGKIPVEVDPEYPPPETGAMIRVGLSFPTELNLVEFSIFAALTAEKIDELVKRLADRNIELRDIIIEAEKTEGDSDDSDEPEPTERKEISVDILGPYPDQLFTVDTDAFGNKEFSGPIPIFGDNIISWRHDPNGSRDWLDAAQRSCRRDIFSRPGGTSGHSPDSEEVFGE